MAIDSPTVWSTTQASAAQNLPNVLTLYINTRKYAQEKHTPYTHHHQVPMAKAATIACLANIGSGLSKKE